MRMRRWVALLALGAIPGAVISDRAAEASSHREAPFVSKNPKIDGTDFYMFRSYETGRDTYVTLIANYLPLQDAYGGPNYFSLDPDALYEIHVDNNGDAVEDITFQFQFKNALANGGSGAALDIGTGAAKKTVSVPLVNIGPITSDDATKLNMNETYTVNVVRGPRRGAAGQPVTNAAGGSSTFTKPLDNLGTKTFANYDDYAKQFFYSVNIPGCAAPAKMFVGQRAESFAVNLGPIFDLVNAPAAVITNGTTRANRNLVPNPIANKNVTSLALEVPISCLTTETDKPIIGGWTSASVRQARVINPQGHYGTASREGGAWAQVSRLGMPLVNEVVIGLKDKDLWNVSEPKDDKQFGDYVTNPTLPALIEILFPTAKAPTVFPRTDLVATFLTGVTGVNANGSTAEYQRLNTALPVTAAGAQNPLGAALCFVTGQIKDLNTKNAGCDPAGFPNGRRPGDDVVDITLRVAMGYLFTKDADAPARNVAFTDAVLQEDAQFDATFPYLKSPIKGANGNGT